MPEDELRSLFIKGTLKRHKGLVLVEERVLVSSRSK
jgi:hypothetical protein